MARDDPQLKIRLPGDLKERIETAASDNNRTMNAEIVARLQESFDDTLKFEHGVLEDAVAEMVPAMNGLLAEVKALRAQLRKGK